MTPRSAIYWICILIALAFLTGLLIMVGAFPTEHPTPHITNTQLPTL